MKIVLATVRFTGQMINEVNWGFVRPWPRSPFERSYHSIMDIFPVRGLFKPRSLRKGWRLPKIAWTTQYPTWHAYRQTVMWNTSWRQSESWQCYYDLLYHHTAGTTTTTDTTNHYLYYYYHSYYFWQCYYDLCYYSGALCQRCMLGAG